MFFGFKKRTTSPVHTPGQDGFGAPFHIVFEERPLPQGGANRFAYDTLALPMTTPIGTGCGNQRQFSTRQVQKWALQGVTLETLGSPGTPTGQIVTQPLVNQQPDNGLPFTAFPASNDIPKGFA